MIRTSLLTSLSLLAAAGGAAPGATEPVDALDFDNGAFLIEETPSYTIRTNPWSVWGLTDGSDTSGWSSAKGQPRGSTYAWELDTTWRLETLVLVTTNLEEKGYPGVSAKTVELFVAGAEGPWKTLGTFDVGKNERRSHALPKDTLAARVKIVIRENHGFADYTELAEIDLLGTRTAPPPLAKIDGDYATNFGPMRFVTEGEQVYGCYDWAKDGSFIWGTVAGRSARVTWWENSFGKISEGTATFATSRRGDQLRGLWYRGGALAGEWVGPRVPRAQGPKCKPDRKGQLAAGLKRQGHVALYGIRFDTASDVPRPESTATLTELFQTLQAQKDLRVTIEGHTDATAEDAYNLDLSNRRARSVVAWLVKKGIPPARLEAKGYGETRPVAENATAAGRALNRRVEVSVPK